MSSMYDMFSSEGKSAISPFRTTMPLVQKFWQNHSFTSSKTKRFVRTRNKIKIKCRYQELIYLCELTYRIFIQIALLLLHACSAEEKWPYLTYFNASSILFPKIHSCGGRLGGNTVYDLCFVLNEQTLQWEVLGNTIHGRYAYKWVKNDNSYSIKIPLC